MHVITFGEIMGRLYPNGNLRLRQSLPGQINMDFSGAEANVAASIAMLGGSSAFVTALPNNVLGDTCVGKMGSLGVNTGNIIRTDIGRLGLYFLETGANQRPSQVVYDRAGSSVAVIDAGEYNWEKIFNGATWLHTTGITPSLSAQAAQAALDAVKAAKQAGLTVSCDLNFRKKLWKWDASLAPRELAEKTMRGILPFVDVLVANEEDAADVLSIHAEDTDIDSGKLAIGKYPNVAKEIVKQFGNISKVAITLRESISATYNKWGAMLYDAKADKASFGPTKDGEYEPYHIRNIVDRVGGGDSFAAGLIYALQSEEYSSPDNAIKFAAAASCLAHSIVGDFNYVSKSEVESLMGGSGSGRVVR
jgi:2-dehydro-3-deoxygluconokinase